LARTVAIRDIRDLQEALATRDTIAQAVGVLRGLYACEEDTALTVLARLADRTSLGSVDVAASIIATASAGVQMPHDLAQILDLPPGPRRL
jgi:AmiR/NasT family two-component response regulator